MGKLVEIRNNKPNERLVRYVKEQLLPDMESGEIKAFVGVVVFQNGDTSEVVMPSRDPDTIRLDSDRILGCLQRLGFTILCNRHDLDAEDSWRG